MTRLITSLPLLIALCLPSTSMAQKDAPAVSEAEAFASALEEGTMGALQLYIETFPKGENVDAAREQLAVLRGALDLWIAFGETGSINLLYRLIETYPDSGLVSVSQAVIAQAELKMWADLGNQATVSLQEIRQFIEFFPNGQFTNRAQEIIDQRLSDAEHLTNLCLERDALHACETYLSRYGAENLPPIAAIESQAVELRAAAIAEEARVREATEWTRVAALHKRRSYEQFLEQYPDGPFSQKAKDRITLLEQEPGDYAYFFENPSIETAEAYLEKHRRGSNRAEVMMYLEFQLNAERHALEEKAWEDAQASGTLFAYRKFVETYQDSPHADIAWRQIFQLEDSLGDMLGRCHLDHDVRGCRDFLSSPFSIDHPRREDTAEKMASLVAREREESVAFAALQNTRALGTVPAYDLFLTDHQGSVFIKRAREERDELLTHLDRSLTACLNSGAMASCEIYVTKSRPNAPRIEAVRSAITQYEKWREATSPPSLFHLNEFLANYPKGPYSARATLKISQIKAQLDDLAKACVDQGVQTACHSYLELTMARDGHHAYESIVTVITSESPSIEN